MKRSQLINILLVLLIFIAVLVLAQMLLQLLSGFSDLILLFLLGWLVSFILNPVIDRLARRPIPLHLIDLLQPALGTQRCGRLAALRLSRRTAVLIVYAGLVLAIILAVALLVPVAIVQLSQLASHLPQFWNQAPELGAAAQDQLARFGVRVDLEAAVNAVLGGLQTVATSAIQNTLAILTSLFAFLSNLFFVLILSFYIAFDAPRLQRRLRLLIPIQYHEELQFFVVSVDRTFGGFIRGQLVQSLLVGIGTGVALVLFNLNFVLVASLFAAVLMLIPLVGPALSVIPPLLVVLLQAPGVALWLLVLLVVYQFVLVNVVMPRLLSEAVGLHPLLVLAAILGGIKIGGFWGAFFGIPIAGVFWAMLRFFSHDLDLQAVNPGGLWEGDEQRLQDRRALVPPSETAPKPQPPQAQPLKGKSSTH